MVAVIRQIVSNIGYGIGYVYVWLTLSLSGMSKGKRHGRHRA
jgi:hypothetical protein